MIDMLNRFLQQFNIVTANTYVVFSATPVLPSMQKDVLPLHHNNSLIYSFKCSCVSHYIGRTTQRLDVRIKQNVPTKIRNLKYSSSDILTHTYESSIMDPLIRTIIVTLVSLWTRFPSLVSPTQDIT